MNNKDSLSCPCCNDGKFELLINFDGIPLSGIFYENIPSNFQKVDLSFILCQTCGYVGQASLVAQKHYENINRSTELQFPKYVDSLISRLKEYGVKSNDLILELGSNDGKFLECLKKFGFNNLVGVEPSKSLSDSCVQKGFRTINDFFGENLAKEIIGKHGRAKAIICRHTLEHIPNLADFMQGIKGCLEEDSILLMEVPDSTAIVDDLNIYELWDEHFHYFTNSNLELLLNQYNLRVMNTEIYGHLDTRNLIQWCTKVDKLDAQPSIDGNKCVSSWRSFRTKFIEYSRVINEKIATLKKPVYIIGASHCQMNLINFFKISKNIDYCIDDDPEKIGKIPSSSNLNLKIIPTENFPPSVEGSLIKTGFGYHQWTESLCAKVSKDRFQIVDLDEIKSKLF